MGLSLLPPEARRPRLISVACKHALGTRNADGELLIQFLSSARMRVLNKTYLHHNGDTDVISFKYDPPGVALRSAPFGDICVSVPMARAQARQLGHSLLEEILTLVVHGTLHLLGYDDRTPRQKKLMFQQQEKILSALISG